VSQAGPIDTNAWLVENLARAPRQDDEPAAGRKRAAAVKLADLDVGSGTGEANHHVVGDLRHQYITLASVGRREQQVLRRCLRPWRGCPRRTRASKRGFQNAQASAMAAQAPALLKSLVTVPAGQSRSAA
jgi:hypothetical protein